MYWNALTSLIVVLNLVTSVIGWKVNFEPNKLIVKVDGDQTVKVTLSELPVNVIKNFANGENNLIELKSDDVNLVGIEKDKNLKWTKINQKWSKNFTLNGIFLGN